MRLFHVSEEPNIEVFHPRTPTRKDLNPDIKLVWAINEEKLVNFLTPRNCPRVTFYAKEDSLREDIEKYIEPIKSKTVIAIEQNWFEEMNNTTLYIYEFNTENFRLLDEVAGYYVSTKTEIPINKIQIDNLYEELFKRNVELRLISNLWPLANKIKASSLGYSLCRMGYASPLNKSEERK